MYSLVYFILSAARRLSAAFRQRGVSSYYAQPAAAQLRKNAALNSGKSVLMQNCPDCKDYNRKFQNRSDYHTEAHLIYLRRTFVRFCYYYSVCVCICQVFFQLFSRAPQLPEAFGDVLYAYIIKPPLSQNRDSVR